MSRFWSQSWIGGIALMLVSLSGCARLDSSRQKNSDLPDLAPTLPSPQPIESLEPFTVLTFPAFSTPTASTPTASTPRAHENYACITANYYADIIWQQDQPTLSFGLRRQPVRNQPAGVKGNPDGSFTYEQVDRSTSQIYYVRVYPDRTCLLQIVDQASGIASSEESGRLGRLNTDEIR